jgi:hypothetical protein
MDMTFALFSLPFGRTTNYWQSQQGVVVRLPAEAKLSTFSKTGGPQATCQIKTEGYFVGSKAAGE